VKARLFELEVVSCEGNTTKGGRGFFCPFRSILEGIFPSYDM